MLLDYTEEKKQENEKKTQKVLDKYNAIVEQRNAIVSRLQPFIGRELYNLSSDERSVYDLAIKDLHLVDEQLAGGILKRCIEEGCVPFNYLVSLTSSQEVTSRFLRQSAIIGLIPWLEANAQDEDAAKALQRIRSTLDEEAKSDSQMTFFEVRAPYGCSTKEYASILGEILHALNPSIRYAELDKLMARVVAEIPGVMELLNVYPLRLIDKQNEQTEGFFEFQPYLHQMWIQYQPPLNVGPVSRRYHEAVDMTVPNATGINVRLFENGYTVIPVLLHEYCHFRGDHNEASVWLRTQLFSQEFYKKNADADPTADYTFVHMQTLLGRKPSPDKADELGDFIEKYYGKQQSEEVGKKAAMEKVAKINQFVEFNNRTTTWCPEVKLPLLGTQGDEDSFAYRVITDATKRYITMPRRIDRTKFERLLSDYMPSRKDINEDEEEA